MANAHRGEIEATLGGKPYTLCLTLGALAELEHADVTPHRKSFLKTLRDYFAPVSEDGEDE